MAKDQDRADYEGEEMMKGWSSGACDWRALQRNSSLRFDRSVPPTHTLPPDGLGQVMPVEDRAERSLYILKNAPPQIGRPDVLLANMSNESFKGLYNLVAS